MQLKISKPAFWLESTALLVWLKLVMLPLAVWFIFYFINSDWIATTVYRVAIALLIVFLSFYVLERLSLWLSNLPGEQKLIAACDKHSLHFALEESAEFPIDKVLAVSFIENKVVNGIRWPHKKNVIKVALVDEVKELATNFNFPPLVDFLKQADTLARKQQGNKR